MRNNLNLAITLLRDLNGIPKVSNTTINLNLILKKLLESGDVEDLIASRLAGIDDELVRPKVPNQRPSPKTTSII